VFRCAVSSPEPRSSRHSPLQIRFEVASQLHGAVLEFGSCAAGLEHPAFSVTLKFIAMFTGACHWALTRASLICSAPTHIICLTHIVRLCIFRFSILRDFFTSGCPAEVLYDFLISSTRATC
jgi:hypothetical protein